MSETAISPEKKNGGWWISFALRWMFLFPALAYATGGVTPRPAGQVATPVSVAWWTARRLAGRFNAPYSHGVDTAAKWFVAHAFGLHIQEGQFWSLAVSFLCAVPPALLWTMFERRNRTNKLLRELTYLEVRFLLAASMLSYGMAKLSERQGIPQPAPLEWFRPLGEITTGQLMWTWLGYSPIFQFFAGLNEMLGGVLLLFRRTTLLAALLILPVMAYVTALDTTFHVGPAAGAALYGLGALYLIAREWRRLAAAFLFRKATAPPPPRKLWTSQRLVFAARGLWVVVVVAIFWNYVLQDFVTYADIAGRQSPLCGAYRVERFVSNGRVLPEGAADPARWRDVSINWFADYIRIRRMDESELLWSADPGDPYRFIPATGHGYRYGDYRKLLAKTAGIEEQLRFKELPNYGSPHTPALKPLGPVLDNPGFMSHYTRGEFFTVNFVREDSDHLLMRGDIDGADISADLVRIPDDDVELFKSRGALP